MVCEGESSVGRRVSLGCKCSGKLDFRVTDRYTFHWQAPEMNQILATVGANGAYISQMLGAIHPFNEEVDFTMPP